MPLDARLKTVRGSDSLEYLHATPCTLHDAAHPSRRCAVRHTKTNMRTSTRRRAPFTTLRSTCTLKRTCVPPRDVVHPSRRCAVHTKTNMCARLPGMPSHRVCVCTTVDTGRGYYRLTDPSRSDVRPQSTGRVLAEKVCCLYSVQEPITCSKSPARGAGCVQPSRARERAQKKITHCYFKFLSRSIFVFNP